MFHPRRIIHRNRGVRVFVSFRCYDNSNHPSGNFDSQEIVYNLDGAAPLENHFYRLIHEVDILVVYVQEDYLKYYGRTTAKKNH